MFEESKDFSKPENSKIAEKAGGQTAVLRRVLAHGGAVMAERTFA